MKKGKKKRNLGRSLAAAAIVGGLASLFPFRGDFSPRKDMYDPKVNRPAKKLIIAHRGGIEKHRQNSLEAISHSKDTGANYAEIDIQKTKDGEYVLHHDSDINGIDLDSVDYDVASKLASKQGYELPRLEEALKILKEKQMGIAADLKIRGDEGAVLAMIKGYLPKGKIMIFSTNPQSLRKVKESDKAIHTALVMPGGVTHPYSKVRRKIGIVPWRDLKTAKANTVVVRGTDLNKRFYEEAKAGDVNVIPYGIDGDYADDILTEYGDVVGGVIVDEPGEAVNEIRSQGLEHILAPVIAMGCFIFAILLSPAGLTGNVIANSSNNSSQIGVLLFFLGLAVSFLYLRRR
jgi:glycerophosphoryl diester phosphodiesterase